MTALWATGLPAEAGLEYSGLIELLRPVVPLLERLPGHQATVLREALGLAPPGDRRDRFAVGAALLGLFAAATDARPMLVVVDDAQWLNHASADAFRFAARRVSMDRVAILVAVRDGEGREFDTTGFDQLAVWRPRARRGRCLARPVRRRRRRGVGRRSSSDGTTLLDEALTGYGDPARCARLLSLRGRIEHEIGHQVKSRELAPRGRQPDRGGRSAGAASILLYSLAPIHYGGDVDEGLRVAERARELAPRNGSDLDTRADSFLGWALFQSGRGAEGVPILERAIRAQPVAVASRPQLRRAAISLFLLERSAESEQLVQQVVDVARREGPTALSYALDQVARYAVRTGEWSRAVAIGEEGLALTEEIGTAEDVANILVTLARVDAACGHEDRCRERITAATETAAAHGLDTVLHQAQAVVGLLDLGLGRLESAAEQLGRVARSVEQLGLFTRDLTAEPDLVEACSVSTVSARRISGSRPMPHAGRGRAPGGLLRSWPVAGGCWRGAMTTRPATCRRR